jgi:dehydrogenase/reductase SDR family member 4
VISFAGKVVLVTGSTRGIGAAAVRAFADLGASVVISSRKPDACEAVRAELAELGRDAIAVPAHVGRPDDCERLVRETIAHFGRLDVVIANAGMNPVTDRLDALTPETWSKVIDTNLGAAWRLARHALPEIARQGGGAMVMVSSIASFFAAQGAAAYGISKAGLNALTRQLAAEWGPQGVRVNAIAPGTTRTDMIRTLATEEGFLRKVEARTALRRLGEPEDIANAILFLASSWARNITGEILVADGGETMMRAVA